MVRAVLDGSKTQTRRVLKKQFPDDAVMAEMPATDPIGGWVISGHSGLWWDDAASCFDDAIRCPYGQPGDRLWVRENGWERTERTERLACEGDDPWLPYYFDADGYTDQDVAYLKVWGFKRRPSIHMPRWASRILLEITDVRVERLQDISEADARAEGARNLDVASGRETLDPYSRQGSCVAHYKHIWQDINGPDSWDLNPWVWVIEFKRVLPC
jgi:hypothetical protein